MDEVTVKISTPYDDKGAKQAIQDKKELEKPAPTPPAVANPWTTSAKTPYQPITAPAPARPAQNPWTTAAKMGATAPANTTTPAPAATPRQRKPRAAAASNPASQAAQTTAQQSQSLSFYDRQLEIDELRAKHRHKEAEEAQKKLFIDQHSLELQTKYGLTQAEAIRRAERAAAVMKAGGGHGGNLAGWRMIGEAGDMILGPGQVMRAMQVGRGLHMLQGAGFSMGASMGLIGGAVAVGAGALYRSKLIEEDNRDIAFRDHLREQNAASARERGHQRDFGSADEAADKERELIEQAKQHEDKEATLRHEALNGVMGRGFRWAKNHPLLSALNPVSSLAGSLSGYYDKWKTEGLLGMMPSSARAIRENKSESANLWSEAEKQRKLRQELIGKVEMPRIEASELRGSGKTAEAQAIENQVSLEQERKRLEKLFPHDKTSVERGMAAKKSEMEDAGYSDFMQHGGYSELRATELTTQGKMKEARALQYDALWWKTYQSVIEKVGITHADVAKEAADAEVFAKKKQDAGNFARAIDGRAGAGDAIRVATMAARYAGLKVNDGTQQAVTDLHKSVVQQYRSATETAWREKFPNRSYR